jgi:nucleotide-binding universal stress UspA family protein
MAILNVLVPLDGSPLAERALHYLDFLKPLAGLKVRLVAVVETDLAAAAQPSEDWLQRQAHLLEGYLQIEAGRLSGHGFSVETVVLTQLPAQAIIEEARRWHTDLIVLSSHGRSGVQRWHLGSVADKVIRGADCDTLVIGPHAHGVGNHLDAILVPLDGSELAERALPVAMRFAEAHGAVLHLAEVIGPRVKDDESQPLTVSAALAMGFSDEPDVLKATFDVVTAYLNKVRDQVGGGDTSVLVGPAEERLIEYIESTPINLVIMTSHGRGGFLRTALGSVTDRLLGGPVPVLIVRAK